MSASLQAQVLGLAGAPASASNIQSSIKAQLLGIDLSAFSPGDPTAEAVARRDPGAAQATLTFSKNGQSMSLPTELAKMLIGQAYGTALISVEMLGRDNEGTISANLSRVAGLAPPSGAASEAQAPAPSGAAKFSPASLALVQASAISLQTPGQWANLIDTLLPSLSGEQASALASWAQSLTGQGGPTDGATLQSIAGHASPQAMKQQPQEAAASLAAANSAKSDQTTALPTSPQEHLQASMAKSLSQIVPGSGVGFERSVADMSSRGSDEQARMGSEITRFAQASSPSLAQSPQWLAQQAAAASSSEVLWKGQAWSGAPAWLAVGSSDSESENAQEVYGQLRQSPQGSLAWIRLRVEPIGIGPIDLWAALLGAGRCHARLRAPEKSKEAFAVAQSAFSAMLEGAKVDLRVDFGPDDNPDPSRSTP